MPAMSAGGAPDAGRPGSVRYSRLCRCHLLEAGVNIKIVSRRLGHASVSFTLDKYSHLMPDDDQQAAVAVAALVDTTVP